MMVLYGLKNCDACRKALKSLEGVEFRDVRRDGVPEDVLKRALARFGAALVNTRSATWRALGEEERAADPVRLLQTHPTLMKRPLIVDGDEMHLGWSEQTRARLAG